MPHSDAECNTLSQNYATAQSELTSTKEALEQAQSQLKERNAAFKPMEEELAIAKAQLTELTDQVTVLNENIIAKDKELTSANATLTSVTTRYKKAVLAAHPEIPEELISGNTITEIDSSLGKAITIVSKVQQNIQTKNKQMPVPAGAPPRGEPDLSGLSPHEKIIHGINQNKGNFV